MSNIIIADDFKFDDPIEELTFNTFGIRNLFPIQRFVIANILDSLEQNDNQDADKISSEPKNQIVLLPTGAGKSICFQVPALVLPHPTLIIYPLLALMTDQQRRMEENNIECVVFRGGQSQEERNENFHKLKTGTKVIIANPEVLENKNLINEFKQIGISHIAIDEAHCVSEWGDTFRPSYLNLGNVIKEINAPVVTAFTATASPEVLKRITEVLFDGSANIIQNESDRPNIHYYVKYAAAKTQAIINLAKTEEKPMIIFCGTRDKTEEISETLNLCYGNDFSRFYHAGLEKAEKTTIEEWFFHQKNVVLCATCAYGMGIDKKDIKTVVHLEPPQTAEAYIQEAGRGGRDGSVANAILLWNKKDEKKFIRYSDESRYKVLFHFATTNNCRRQVLLDALGGEQAVCSGCDLCNKKYNLQNKGINDNLEIKDYELALKIISKRQRFFTKDTFSEEAQKQLNNFYKKTTNLNIWNSNGIDDILEELFLSKKIKYSCKLWKNKLETKSLIHQIRNLLHFQQKNHS